MQENPREFHAVADLFPRLCGSAFEELVADIKQKGLLDAEGRIRDGRGIGIELVWRPALSRASFRGRAKGRGLSWR